MFIAWPNINLLFTLFQIYIFRYSFVQQNKTVKKMFVLTLAP